MKTALNTLAESYVPLGWGKPLKLKLMLSRKQKPVYDVFGKRFAGVARYRPLLRKVKYLFLFFRLKIDQIDDIFRTNYGTCFVNIARC